MSIQDEIEVREKELGVLKAMQATDFNSLPVDTLFRVSDHLSTLARDGGSLRYLATVNSDFKNLFYKNGCTEASAGGDDDLVSYSYCVAVITDEAAKESAFRKWVLANTTTAKDFKFPMSDFPSRLPRNYLTIIKEVIDL